MSITITYPKNWAEALQLKMKNNHDVDEPISSMIKAAAKHAAEQQLTAKPLIVAKGEDSEETSLWLMRSEHWIKKVKPEQPSVAQTLLAGANAYLLHEQKEDTSSGLLPIPERESRDGQNAVYRFLAEHTPKQPHRIIEASTGIGKGMALVASAIDLHQQNGKQVVISAPTHAILDQLIEECNLLIDTHQLDITYTRTYAKTDFLSTRLLKKWVKKCDNKAVVEQVKGMLKKTYSMHLSVWEALSEQVPLPSLTLFHDVKPENEPGYQQYLDHRASDKNSPLVFCTHAMLGFELLRRRQINVRSVNWDAYATIQREHAQRGDKAMPWHVYDNQTRYNSEDEDLHANLMFSPDAFHCVDEAHMLEGCIRSAMSQDVSLHELSKHVKKQISPLSPDASTEIIAQINKIWTLPRPKESSILLVGHEYGTLYRQALHELSAIIRSTLTKQVKARLDETIEGRECFRSLMLLRGLASQDYGVMISLSDVKKYVRVRFPGGSAKKYTHYLGLCSSGLRLVSASIHIAPSKAKLTGYEYQLSGLGLGFEQTVTHPPIESTWLRENVNLFVAKKDSAFDPKSDQFAELIATQIMQGDAKTLGGTLVLFTSYDLIEQCHEVLKAHLPPERLMAQASGEALSKNKAKYLALYHAGKRPVWLATGGAWTGLDLSDFSVAPKEDQVISRLIVPKLPFNVPDEARDMNIFDSGHESYFKLKQGFGRLIRRAGRAGMCLELLDKRVHRNSPLYKASLKLLKQYQNNLV